MKTTWFVVALGIFAVFMFGFLLAHPKSCIGQSRHRWTNWETVKEEQAIGKTFVLQRHTCEKCGFSELEYH